MLRSCSITIELERCTTTVGLLDGLAYLVEPVEVHFLWRPQLRDPADELVLEAAVNASAQALLTFNLKHFTVAVDRFRLQVALPGSFLRSFP